MSEIRIVNLRVLNMDDVGRGRSVVTGHFFSTQRNNVLC
jgi:hypothetical protein